MSVAGNGVNPCTEGSTFTPKRHNGLGEKENPLGWKSPKIVELEGTAIHREEENIFLSRTRNEGRRSQGGVPEEVDLRNGKLPKSAFQIREYNAPNWFTRKGVFRKRKAIEKKGLPAFKRCKLITLTLDPIVGGRAESYELGKDRLRRFLRSLRGMLGCKFAWAWKLEFQENGYAHWHLIVDYKPKIPLEGLRYISEIWGLGRTNVKAISKDDFSYLFKYVSKGVFGDANEDGTNLPDWVLDYRRIRKDGRPSSGIRFWQTGGGFYQTKAESKKSEKEQKYSLVSYTIRDQIKIWNRKATAVVTNAFGKIIASKQMILKRPWCEFFQTMVWKLLDGKAAYVGESWLCRVKHIEEEVSLCLLKSLRRLELLT